MISSLKNPVITAIRGFSLLLVGVVGFAAVLVAAVFAMLMTVGLRATRPLAGSLERRPKPEPQPQPEPRLTAAPAR